MKQTTKRFLSLVISFFFLVATMIIYFSLIVPASAEEQQIKAQMIGRQNFVDNQKSAISQVQKLISSYKGEGQLQEVVSSILPFSQDLAGAFSQIGGLVEANNLLMQGTVVSLPVNQPTAKGAGTQLTTKPLGSFDFQVRVVGSYEDFKSFLENIETNIRIFDVKKINLQSTAKQNQNVYNFDLTISTYYQNP